MTTVGTKYARRMRDASVEKVIDTRVKRVIRAMMQRVSGPMQVLAVRKLTAVFMLVVLLTSASRAAEQAVIGTVMDVDSVPLAFVNVQVEGTARGTMTDVQGRFRLEHLAEGTVQLVFSFIGYEMRSISVSPDQRGRPIIVLLTERVVDLPVFTIQNSMTGGSGPSRRLPGSAWYVSPKELEQFHYTDINRSLRTVPGVNLQEEDGFGLRPNIGLRGAGSERSSKITLMEDGMLIAPAPYAAPAAYYFPTAGRMHAIEVVKGSSQVRYGPLTTGGAVNLISTPVPQDKHGQVAIWGGSWGIRNVHANAGAELGQVGFMVETFQQEAEGFKQLDGGGNTGFGKQDYLGKLQWRSDTSHAVDHAFSVKAGSTVERSNETYLGLTLNDFNSTPMRRYAGSQADKMELEHDQFSIQYALTLPSGLKFVTTAYRTNTHRNWYKLDKVKDTTGTSASIADITDQPLAHPYAYGVITGANSIDNSLQVKANNRNYQSSGIQMLVDHRLSGANMDHAIEGGLRVHNDYMDRYQWTDGHSMNAGQMQLTASGTPGTESNRVASANAVAGHLAYTVTRKGLSVSPGLRFEHMTLAQDEYGKNDPGRSGTDLVRTENTVDVWIPGIGVEQRITERFSTFGGIHKGFSPPGTDPTTKPEESVNYELGMRSKAAAWEIQLIGFFNDYSELLGTDLAAAGGTGSGDLFNAGSATVKGLELFTRVNLLHGRSGSMKMPLIVSYTFTDARFGSSFESDFEPWGNVVEGDRIPYTPVHQLNARLSLEGRRGELSVNCNYVSEMNAVTGALADDLAHQVPSHVVVDLAATLALKDGISVFGTVQDALAPVYAVGSLPAGWRPGMPRTLLAGVRVRF